MFDYFFEFISPLINIINTNEIEPNFFGFWVFCIFFAFIGAMIGSFINLYIYRFPLMESFSNASLIINNFKDFKNKELSDFYESHKKFSLSKPTSHCPNCKTKIKWYQNIPIFSYIFLKGKCSNCKIEIPISYFLVEIFMGFSWYSIFILNRNVPETLFLGVIYSTLITMSVIDIKEKIAPYTGLFLCFIAICFQTIYINKYNIVSLESGIVTMILFYTISFSILKIINYIYGYNMDETAMGVIDLQLISILSVLIGFEKTLNMVFFMAFYAVMYFLLCFLLSKKEPNRELPLIPFITVGFFTVLFFKNFNIPFLF